MGLREMEDHPHTHTHGYPHGDPHTHGSPAYRSGVKIRRTYSASLKLGPGIVIVDIRYRSRSGSAPGELV